MALITHKHTTKLLLLCAVVLAALEPSALFGQATAPTGASGSSAAGSPGGGIAAAPVNAPGNTNPAPSSASIGNSTSATASGAVQPGASGSLGNIGPLNLTLADVVNVSLGNNTAIIEARQRLQKAQEQIVQLNAQARPQLRGDAADDYNSYKATTTTLGPTVQNPVLPSGGTIPAITDQAAAEASSLTATTSTSASIAPGIATATGAGAFGEPPGSTGANPGVASGASTTPSAPAPIGAAPSAGNTGTTSVNNGQTATPGGAAAPTGPNNPNGATAASPNGANGANGAATNGQNGTSSNPVGGVGGGTSGTTAGGAAGPTNGTPAGGESGTTNNGVDNNGGSTNSNGAGTSGNGIGGAGSNGGNSSGTPSGTTNGNGTANSTGTDSGGASTNGTSYMPAQHSTPVAQLAALPSIIAAYITATGDDGAGVDDSAPDSGSYNGVDQREARSEGSRAQSGSATPEAATTPTNNTLSALSTTDAQRNSYAARLSASQYIDLFGYVPAARDVQDSIRDFYALDLVRTENETALNAKNTFFNALLAASQVDVQQEQVNYAAENVRITTARRQQGIAADYDVLTAETALANAQQLLITAQNQVDLAKSQLSYLLGTSPDRSINLVSPALPPLSEPIDLSQGVTAAQQRRPEILQANRDVNIASRLVKLAGATLSPTLGVVGIAEYANTASEFTPHSLATVGAQLGVPLDDGGATRSRIRSAKVDLQTQLLNRSSLQLSVSLEVREAILNIRNAQARVSTAQVGVTQAEEALRLANVRFQNGLGTFLDVTNALAQLATARNNLASAQYFYQISLAQLVRNEGGR